MIYATLRGDQSDASIRQAWIKLLESFPQPDAAARMVLDRLDLKDGYISFGISPRDITRTEWEMRLTDEIVAAGYAIPQFDPSVEEEVARDVPPLIKMLGVTEHLPSLLLKPRSAFAAEVIGSLSGEPEDVLRNRSSLRLYYEQKDYHGAGDESS